MNKSKREYPEYDPETWKKIIRLTDDWVKSNVARDLDREEIASSIIFWIYLYLSTCMSAPKPSELLGEPGRLARLIALIGRRVTSQEIDRRKKAKRLLENAEMQAEALAAAVIEEATVQTGDLAQALNTLSDEERELLNEWQAGDSLETIGQRRGITRQAICKRLAGIFGKLRRRMEGQS